MDDLKFSIGMAFSSGLELIMSIRSHKVKNKRKITFKNNLSNKIQVTCEPIAIYICMQQLKLQREDTFNITRIIKDHTCSREWNIGPALTSSWLANKYKVRLDPKWDVDAFHVKVVNDL